MDLNLKAQITQISILLAFQLLLSHFHTKFKKGLKMAKVQFSDQTLQLTTSEVATLVIITYLSMAPNINFQYLYSS